MNLCIVYEFNIWPHNSNNNFTLKNCLFGTVKLTRKRNKSKFTYKDFWSFGNDSTKNVVIFGVDNSSSSHVDNPKNISLVLDKGPTEGINSSVGTAEIKISIKFSKDNTKLCLSLHYNGDESYLYVNNTEIYKFKAKDIISGYNFCLENVSKDFTKNEQTEISLNGTVCDFSVDHSSVKKEDIIFTSI